MARQKRDVRAINLTLPTEVKDALVLAANRRNTYPSRLVEDWVRQEFNDILKHLWVNRDKGATKHPACSCTPAQRRAFEKIAAGDSSDIDKRCIKVLLRKGLIYETQFTPSIPTESGPAILKSYHIKDQFLEQWHRWCSENSPART